MGGPGLYEGRHALDGVQPPDREGQGQSPSVRWQRDQQVVQVVEGVERGGRRIPALDRGRDLAGRPVERHRVDAFGHHRDATALAFDIDTEQVPEVRRECRTREDDQLRRLLLDLAQQEDPEHEVLDLVDAADVLTRQDPVRLARRDRGVGIGSQRQHHGNAEVAGRLGCGPGPDVGHAQVEHVNLTPVEDAPHRPPGGDPQRPRLGSGHRRPPEGDRQVVVTRAVDRLQTRVVAGSATRDGEHAPHGTGIREQRVAQVHEEGGDAPGVPLTGASQVAVDVRVQEELGHGQPLSYGPTDPRIPALVQVGASEAGDRGEGAVGSGDGVQDGVDLRVERVRLVAEGGQGRCPRRRQLVVVGGELEEYARRDHPGYQPERFDQPTARTFERDVRHGGDQRIAHQPWLLRGERLQRGLGQGSGEATVEDQVDQARQGRGDRGARAQRPRRVLAEERPLLVQQGRQSLPRLLPREVGERVDGRDRGDLVRPVRDREVQVSDRGRRVAGCRQ